MSVKHVEVLIEKIKKLWQFVLKSCTTARSLTFFDPSTKVLP